jgi:hypothetical protein
VGVADLGKYAKSGGSESKAGYCLAISAISVGLALCRTNVIRPGKRIDESTAARLQQRYGRKRVAVEQAQGAKSSEPVLMQVIKRWCQRINHCGRQRDTQHAAPDVFLIIGVGITLLPKERTAAFVAALKVCLPCRRVD